jgi:hypothetical protein
MHWRRRRRRRRRRQIRRRRRGRRRRRITKAAERDLRQTSDTSIPVLCRY